MMKTICLSFIQKQTPEINVENFDISNQVVITVLGSLSNKNSNGNENVRLRSLQAFPFSFGAKKTEEGEFWF